MNVKEDEKGYIWYLNEGQSEPNHPKLNEFLEKLNEKHTTTKYFTYRCAGKLFALAEFLLANRIPYQLVLGILDRHRLQNASTVTPAKLKQIVFDIYYASSRLGYFSDGSVCDVELKKHLALSLLWNIFDPKRNKGALELLELKQLMLILCESSCFESKLYEYFDMVSDHNQCIPRAKFEAMLLNFARIFAYIDDSANQFGVNWITGTLRDSYEESPGLGGLNNFQFLQLWQSTNTNFSNFSSILSLLQRMNESQYVLHSRKCSSCGIYPIRGLRFKCQRCRKLSLCLKCFSTGYASDKHNPSHKMYELSSNDGQINHLTAFLSKFFNIFRGKSHSIDTGTTNFEVKLVETATSNDPNCTTSVKISSHGTLKRATMNKSLAFGGGQTISRAGANTGRILKIVDELQEQNERFSNNLNNLRDILSEKQLSFLAEHYNVVQSQIKELREVAHEALIPFSSTPFRTVHNKKRPPLTNIRSPLSNNNMNGSTPLLNSIHGSKIHPSYVDAHYKSASNTELSTWISSEGNPSLPPPLRDFTLANVPFKILNSDDILLSSCIDETDSSTRQSCSSVQSSNYVSCYDEDKTLTNASNSYTTEKSSFETAKESQMSKKSFDNTTLTPSLQEFTFTDSKFSQQSMNFTKLFKQVNSVAEDSNADNQILAERTKKFEKVVDYMIAEEEERLSYK